MRVVFLAPSYPPEMIQYTRGLAEVGAVERGTHTDDLAQLWDEMTMVRRSQPAGTQW